MIMLSARVVAHPSERRELAQALLVWVAAARKDTDLVTAQVYEDLEVPAVFGLVTEWKAFRRPDFARLKSLMNAPVLFDGRNIWSPEEVRALGFTYSGIGRP
jgi:UDP-glucose 6-dehydrogenase